MKTKKVRLAIKAALQKDAASKEAETSTGVGDTDRRYEFEAEATRILELAKHQGDY